MSWEFVLVQEGAHPPVRVQLSATFVTLTSDLFLDLTGCFLCINLSFHCRIESIQV